MGQTLTLLSSLVLRMNGMVIGRALVMNVESFGSKSANLLNFVLQDDDDFLLKKMLLSAIIRNLIDLEYHRLIIHTGLWGIVQNDSYFDGFNLNFHTKLAFYEKQL